MNAISCHEKAKTPSAGVAGAARGNEGQALSARHEGRKEGLSCNLLRQCLSRRDGVMRGQRS